MLKRLHEYDKAHKSSLFYMLYVYLITERSATDTSAALSMHRNNVIYHINRIQDMLEVDLDRSDIRQLILLSYSLLQMYGFEDEEAGLKSAGMVLLLISRGFLQ
jgi:DNA-binding PucR family transcriptional regulator